jgi:predicted nucleotidyltransferase
MNSQIQSILEKIVERLKEKYQPEKIILFGSYAWGNPNEESDIDLLIIKPTTKPFHKRWAEVYKLVQEIVWGIPFSPFVVTPEELKKRIEIGDQFFEQILKEGKILHGK